MYLNLRTLKNDSKEHKIHHVLMFTRYWYFYYVYGKFVITNAFLTPKNVGQDTKNYSLRSLIAEILANLNSKRRPF